MARGQRPWTYKELETVERLRLDGLTVCEVALCLGRSPDSVLQAVQRNGLSRRPRRRLARWAQLLTRPHTIAGAACVMGVTPGAVRNAKWLLRQAGFECPEATREEERGREE